MFFLFLSGWDEGQVGIEPTHLCHHPSSSEFRDVSGQNNREFLQKVRDFVTRDIFCVFLEIGNNLAFICIRIDRFKDD